MLNPGLPNLSTAVGAWSSKISFAVVGKRQQDFETVETLIPKTAYGMFQPMRPQLLNIKPEGERSWRWQELYVSPSCELSVDDIVVFDRVRYRVMSKQDFSYYGFVRYELLQDYQTT